MSSHFAQVLKIIRTNRGLTQEDVAFEVGKSPATIGQYEQNRIDPPYEVLDKLINAYDIDANVFFERKMHDDDNKEYLNQLVSCLSDRQKKSLAEHLFSMMNDPMQC
jgi:transcriptional regulator with XRE-family HTH domain